MTPGKDYAACPHCAANNVTYRQVCWRCGYILPYTIGLDGTPRFNTDASTMEAGRAEISRLLDEAQTLDLEAARQRREDDSLSLSELADTDLASRLKLWMGIQRRRERPSGA